ncbi:unnamed protein product [Victoria cruziana]
MLENPPYFYYVGLEGMFVGNRWIQAPESLRGFHSAGNGGLVVDYGTTFTMPPAKLRRLKAEFLLTLGKDNERAEDGEEAIGRDESRWMESVPKLVLVFRGNASVEIPEEESRSHVASSNTPGASLWWGPHGRTNSGRLVGPRGCQATFGSRTLK